MGYNFLPYDQNQEYLLPKSLHDWVDDDSLERFVSDLIDQFDDEGRLEPFYARYRADGWGHPAYHPRLLLKILVFGYCHGIQSSRKLARLLDRDIAFRFLAANQQPDFRTISDFRKHHTDAFEALFEEILTTCQEAELADLGRVALDGRRVQGDASLQANFTRDQLREEVRKLIEEAERIDDEEDELYGPENRGDELPEGLRDPEQRRERIQEAIDRLDEREQELKDEQAEKIEQRKEEEEATGQKKRGRKPKHPDQTELPDDTKANVTDPDSQTMKTHNGWVQGYNGQAMVDTDSQVIVAQAVTNEANDKQQLEPMVERCEAIHGNRPDELLADAGYWSTANAELGDDDLELFVATKKDQTRRKELREKGPPRGRIPDDYGLKELMERKLRTKRGRTIYKERGMSVEPVFGQLVQRGLDRFLLRGKDGAATEWSLFSATHNLLKLFRSGWKPDREPGPAAING